MLSSGVLPNKSIKNYQLELNDQSIKYVVEPATENAPQDNALGKIIRIKEFTSKNEAESLANKLKGKKLFFNVRYSAQEGLETTGPFEISILRVELNTFNGKLVDSLAKQEIQGTETVSSMYQREKALAGINGGFFVFSNEVGDFGAPAGLYVKDGVVIRESANDRPVLIIDNGGSKSRIEFGTAVKTELTLSQGKNTLELNGINRAPGKLLNCGGFDSKPSINSLHDYLCTNDSEAIAYTEMYGKYTPNVKAVEIEISPNGDVLSIGNATNTKIKPKHTYIQLTGKKTFS